MPFKRNIQSQSSIITYKSNHPQALRLERFPPQRGMIKFGIQKTPKYPSFAKVDFLPLLWIARKRNLNTYLPRLKCRERSMRRQLGNVLSARIPVWPQIRRESYRTREKGHHVVYINGGFFPPLPEKLIQKDVTKRHEKSEEI
ncbi:hypothetical protein TNCT_169281 [Trichonephila clavata]|uniref:Uncharacterized protein n=1 Tax=Trichonephila clavata TaxID=2740835 RepID=A0A8X6F448_TRICU|nr:hypothetical protein TNCT_169281 [Trichonephila clavata]